MYTTKSLRFYEGRSKRSVGSEEEYLMILRTLIILCLLSSELMAIPISGEAIKIGAFSQVSITCDGESPSDLAESCWQEWDPKFLELRGNSKLVWVRFPLENLRSTVQDLVLYHPVISTQKINLFVGSGDTWQEHELLKETISSEKNMLHLAQKFSLPPGEHMVYVRLLEALRLNLILMDAEEYKQVNWDRIKANLMTTGAFLVIGAFMLIRFLVFRKMIYLVLVFGALGSILRQLFLDGGFRLYNFEYFYHISIAELTLLASLVSIFPPLFIYAFFVGRNKTVWQRRLSNGILATVPGTLAFYVFTVLIYGNLSPTEVFSSPYANALLSFLGVTAISPVLLILLFGLPKDVPHFLLIVGVAVPILDSFLTYIALKGNVDIIINSSFAAINRLAPIFLFIVARSLDVRRTEREQLAKISALNTSLKFSLDIVEKKANERAEKIVDLEKRNVLGEMAGGVAHEINSPLATIDAIAKRMKRLLDRKALEISDVGKYSHKIVTNTERIFSITSGLKFFSDSSHSNMNRTDIDSVLKDVVFYANQLHRRSGFHCQYQSKNHAYVDCDKNYISHIALTLIERSIIEGKDLKEKWVNLTLEQENTYCLLIFTDAGGEVSEQTQSFIENPFVSDGRQSKGWGLKLSIIRELIVQQNGKISVDRAENCDRIILKIPLATEELKEAA